MTPSRLSESNGTVVCMPALSEPTSGSVTQIAPTCEPSTIQCRYRSRPDPWHSDAADTRTTGPCRWWFQMHNLYTPPLRTGSWHGSGQARKETLCTDRETSGSGTRHRPAHAPRLDRKSVV